MAETRRVCSPVIPRRLNITSPLGWARSMPTRSSTHGPQLTPRPNRARPLRHFNSGNAVNITRVQPVSFSINVAAAPTGADTPAGNVWLIANVAPQDAPNEVSRDNAWLLRALVFLPPRDVSRWERLALNIRRAPRNLAFKRSRSLWHAPQKSSWHRKLT